MHIFAFTVSKIFSVLTATILTISVLNQHYNCHENFKLIDFKKFIAFLSISAHSILGNGKDSKTVESVGNKINVNTF